MGDRQPADRIRNVALVGHRGAGKTSLHEALLFEAGATSRLGSVPDASTVSDADPDEQSRQMSISASLSSFHWRDRKINLLDTPGEPSFVADALGALRVCESAVFVVNAVMGVEVSTSRLWTRAAELDIARMLFVNMLDRERADFYRALEQIKRAFGPHAVATEIPIGVEQDVEGVIDLVDMKAYRQDSAERAGWSEMPIPEQEAERAQEFREKLMDEVCEVSDTLMERYLEGEEISHQEIVDALKEGTNHGKIFPVVCGVATRNLGTTRLLDAIVEDLPSPVKHGALQVGEVVLAPDEDKELFAYVFKTRADAFAGRINLMRVYQGVLRSDSHVLNTRAHVKERIGQLIAATIGKDVEHAEEFGPGDIGAVPKLKDVVAGDVLAERPMIVQGALLPAPIVSVAVEPKVRGEDEKMATALRRLSEEDPTLRISRDERTSELLVSGLSQMHVEVTVERVKRRFGVEIVTHPPRVPYFEAIRKKTRAHARYKKQTGGRGQFGDCHIEVEPLPAHEGYEFIDKIVGGVIPQGFRPAVDKGIQETMHAGDLAGYPVIGVRVTLVDGSYHSVDSSEMAFRIAGSMAFKKAYSEADPVLLEPIMAVEITSPSETVGDVIGDLNSRRGRPLGMDPVGQNTVIRAEVPMSEMLSYAPDLTSLTGGRGDYAMTLARYARSTP